MKLKASLRSRGHTAVVVLGLFLSTTAMIGAPVASAATDIWRGGSNAQYIGPGAPWAVGPPHLITANHAWIVNSACVGAIDVYGGGLSGVGACGSWGYWAYVTHPYCGCVLRDPAVYPNGSLDGFLGTAAADY